MAGGDKKYGRKRKSQQNAAYKTRAAKNAARRLARHNRMAGKLAKVPSGTARALRRAKHRPAWQLSGGEISLAQWMSKSKE